MTGTRQGAPGRLEIEARLRGGGLRYSVGAKSGGGRVGGVGTVCQNHGTPPLRFIFHERSGDWGRIIVADVTLISGHPIIMGLQPVTLSRVNWLSCKTTDFRGTD